MVETRVRSLEQAFAELDRMLTVRCGLDRLRRQLDAAGPPLL